MPGRAWPGSARRRAWRLVRSCARPTPIVARWPTWFKLTVGRFAGIPFRLSFWQE
jgi:hypothetical protein